MRVVVAADREAVRSALHLLLEQKLGVSAVAEAGTIADLATLLTTQAPHVLVLDARFGGKPIDDLLRRVRAYRPSLKVLALSSQPEQRAAAVAAGADAFADETCPVDQLCDTLRALLAPSTPLRAGPGSTRPRRSAPLP